MAGSFRAVKVTDRVFWVGAVDWGLRDFHGYATGRGSTYNAYLVLADKVALVDTVKAPFMEEMLARVASVIEPSRIDYIVSNHSEMDHSGCLHQVAARVGAERVFASKMGVKALAAHFHEGGVTAVADGETLSLGNATLTFLETPMLHWPDSMMTYLAEEGGGILFSQDGFGMHLASAERFDEELPEPVLLYEAAKYYANILLPYSPLILKALERLRFSGLPLGIIAPDHGPVWRGRVDWILGLYERWATQRPTMKAVVAYDTMWGSTALMARAVADGLAAGGASPKVLPLAGSHRSDVVTELLEAGALLVGSPTMNNGLFPTVADLLCYLHGLRPHNKVGAAFGSYGWSGEAVGRMEEELRGMGVEPAVDGLKVQYVPTEEDLARCRAFGESVAARLKEVCA